MGGAGRNERDEGPGSGCGGCLAAPFVVAAVWARPSREDRVVDEGIEAAQIARTAIGVLATAWLVYVYPMRESAKNFVEDKLVEVFISAGVLAVVGPAALVAFVIAARGPHRALYRARLMSPLLSFASLLGSAGLLWFLLLQGGGHDLANSPGLPALLQPVVLILTTALALFMVPLTLATAFLSVHHVFRTADVHEVLPPLISPVLVWSMFAIQLFDSPPVAAPLWIRILFLVGPPLSVTALSAWELRRLRTHHGMTLRGALSR
ncbi:hypothetical protein AB0K09_27815 [Streptomyces sp. NPDC049577]|uniref:hypothetical protein n=1 Tax=Streptomyces sp. NPDC049577 TaxID=3155153 RepID=UPI0034473BEC